MEESKVGGNGTSSNTHQADRELVEALRGMSLGDRSQASTAAQRALEIEAKLDGNESRSHAKKELCEYACLHCQASFEGWLGLRQHLRTNRSHVLSSPEREDIKEEYKELAAIKKNQGRMTRIQRRRWLLVLYDLSQLIQVRSTRS